MENGPLERLRVLSQQRVKLGAIEPAGLTQFRIFFPGTDAGLDAVYFRDGQILFAASNDPQDQLASILVEEGKLGTAYGLMTLIQNIGLAGFNFMIGWANDYSGASIENPGGYGLGMWIFSVLGFLALLVLVMPQAGCGGEEEVDPCLSDNPPADCS